MSTLNWGDLVKDAGETAGGNYEPLPDGDYDLKVIEASATTSQSGKTMFKITTEVQVGPHAKRRVWDNLVISPESSNALGIFFSKMAALGLPREFFTNSNPTNAQIESMLVGRTFRAQIGSRTWNGSKRNELKRYYVQQTAGTVPAQTAAPAAPAAPPAPPAAPTAAGVAVPPAPPSAPF